jgi:tellurite resistance protein
MFGYGTLCWLIFGTVVLARLFGGPELAPPLRPTLAILVAPPVVAGNAWFAMNGDRLDTISLFLGGFAVLMVVMQLRLIPVFLQVPFGPGSWAFSFSYAAAFAFAIRWLGAEHAPDQRGLAYALLAIITAGIAALATMTINRLVQGRYLSQAQYGEQPAPAVSVRPAYESAGVAGEKTRRSA